MFSIDRSCVTKFSLCVNIKNNSVIMHPYPCPKPLIILISIFLSFSTDGVIFEALYNSDMMFSERKYAALDVDLCRIKLHEPMSVIVKQPLLYVRDMVPRPCFEALIKLDQVRLSNNLFSIFM